MKWIGQHIVDSIAKFRNTVDFSDTVNFSEDVTFYQPVNNADPTINIGASDDERLMIKVSYQGTTTQSAQIVNFKTFTESGTAHDGRFVFGVDEDPILKIQDGGIDFFAGKGIGINGVDILTDNGSGASTLSNIDALDATTISTFETAMESNIDTLANLTSIGTITTGVWNGSRVASAYLDPDTAHLTTDQTFTGTKTFDETIVGSVNGSAASAITATHVTVTGNESTNENNLIPFLEDASANGNSVGLESDGDLTYNPSTGKVTATGFVGALTGQADTVATIAGLAPNTATTQAIQPAIESIGTDGDTLQILSDVLSMTNATSGTPHLQLVNSTDDVSAPFFKMINQRGGSAGVDGDDCGTMQFLGYNDEGTPAAQVYATILGEIHDATSNEESGKLTFRVANHDGGLGTGLKLTGGSENNEIDVVLGLGANSVVTIPGNIDLAGDIDVDGTLETDALTIGGATIAAIGTTAITTVGTIENGTWESSTAVIAAAYLDADLAYLSGTQTFTGTKTLNSFKGTAGATVTNILDEDAMGSNSATALATQQSIKAYADTKRPNLYWFGVCDTATTSANANLGAFPSTDVSIVSFANTTLTNDTDVFTLDTADEVTITRAGVYKFTYNVLLEITAGSNRTEGAIGILRDRATDITLIDGSRSSTYNRFNAAADAVSRGSGSVSMLIDVAVDDSFYIGFYKEAHHNGNTKMQTVPSGTTWTIEAVT